jgi:hypothetical protein
MQKSGSPVAQRGDWKISSKAIDLLQCFMSGLDDVIVRIALGIADEKRRSGHRVELRIEADDIEQAANAVLEQIRSTDLPQPVKTEIDEMDECLKAKCKALR